MTRSSFQAPETSRSTTEATVLIEIFGEEELVAANGRGPVQAVDNAMRKILEKHYPQLSEVRLEEFDVRLLHHGTAIGDDEDKGAGALVRVLAIFFRWRRQMGVPWAWLRISYRPASSALSTGSDGSP